MNREAAIVVLFTLLSGCSNAPVVYAPTDFIGGKPSGRVAPLKDLLATGRPVRMVLLHGVGDHCYGYALEPSTGWLDAKAVRRTGLRETQVMSPAHSIYSDVFLEGPRDAKSFVQYGTRRFMMELPGATSKHAIEAIEITWSHTTQWIKSSQLGYDSTAAPSVSDGGARDCVEPPAGEIPVIKRPPDRLLLDKVIKETVFDRNLADAILYSGAYGQVMERGVAEALCHAVTNQPDDRACVWPSDAQDDGHTYVFVTHSLGSRLIYDMILNLVGYDTGAKPNPFTRDEWNRARPFVSGMLANTAAFYMMANQLSLLGLASVPATARSDTGPRPYALTRSHCQNVVAAIADAHARVLDTSAPNRFKLQVIAFNDTNDLLTWHVPGWYANAGPSEIDCRPEVDLVNVFVQNDTHWFVVESPAAAHSNYFRNPDVWNVITCGAEDGKVIPC